MRFLTIPQIFWQAIKAFRSDNVPRMGASLSYYTLFAIGPVLLIAVAVAGSVLGTEAAQGEILGQLEGLIGVEGARAVQSMLVNAGRDSEGGMFAAIIGGVTLLIAATGAFLELQAALNGIWRVQATPGSRLLKFFRNRLRSFGLVVGIGFLLLVSLVISAALAAFSRWLDEYTQVFLWNIVDVVVSLGIFTVLFAAIYKFLPDVKLRWHDVWLGGFVTALLFSIGKKVIGLYLGNSSVASSYGAAGSVIVLLLWVYYSSQIVLFGAEVTRIWTERGERRRPRHEEYAEKNANAPREVAEIGAKS